MITAGQSAAQSQASTITAEQLAGIAPMRPERPLARAAQWTQRTCARASAKIRARIGKQARPSPRLPNALYPHVSAHLRVTDVLRLEAAVAGPGRMPELWQHLEAPLREALPEASPKALSIATVIRRGVPSRLLEHVRRPQREAVEHVALQLPPGSALQLQVLGADAFERALELTVAGCVRIRTAAHTGYIVDGSPLPPDAASELRSIAVAGGRCTSAWHNDDLVLLGRIKLAAHIAGALARPAHDPAALRLPSAGLGPLAPIEERHGRLMLALRLHPEPAPLHAQLATVHVLCAASEHLIRRAVAQSRTYFEPSDHEVEGEIRLLQRVYAAHPRQDAWQAEAVDLLGRAVRGAEFALNDWGRHHGDHDAIVAWWTASEQLQVDILKDAGSLKGRYNFFQRRQRWTDAA